MATVSRSLLPVTSTADTTAPASVRPVGSCVKLTPASPPALLPSSAAVSLHSTLSSSPNWEQHFN